MMLKFADGTPIRLPMFVSETGSCSSRKEIELDWTLRSCEILDKVQKESETGISHDN